MVGVDVDGTHRVSEAYEVLAPTGKPMLRAAFENGMLVFDCVGIHDCRVIASAGRVAGHPVPTADWQIAAIVHSRGMAMATRNVQQVMQDDLSDRGNRWYRSGARPRVAIAEILATYAGGAATSVTDRIETDDRKNIP